MTNLADQPEQKPLWTMEPVAMLMGRLVVRFFVPGTPRPGGSKRVFLNSKTGKPIVTDAAGKGNREWRNAVMDFAQQAYQHEPLSGILGLSVTFVMPHPKSHYRKGGTLKQNIPTYHGLRPDATKLLRSTEDALTGILWLDDAQIVEQFVRKVYGLNPGAEIVVEELTA